MESAFPNAMFASRRALCPRCGASVPLEGSRAQERCSFCDAVCVVERRLRHAEPDVDARRSIEIDWVPSHLNPGTPTERVSCGGCGGPLSVVGLAAVVHCDRCDTDNRVERRTRLLAEIPLDAAADEDDRSAAAQLVRGLATLPSLADRVTLAKEAFAAWHHIGPPLAARADTLMRIIVEADPRLGQAIAGGVGKLLCADDVAIHLAVIDAAPRYLQDPAGSHALIWHVGLGPPACLKPLLDAADVLWQRGALALACQALLAANTLIGRHLSEKERLGEIILYRLPYLSGPVLAWSLACLGGAHPLYHRFPAETLIRFVDDIAAEKPDLVPEVARHLRPDPIEHETDYRARLDLWPTLQTALARQAFLLSLPEPPPGASLRIRNEATDLVAANLDAFGAPACDALIRLMETAVPAKVHALVRARGDALPLPLRRAYLKAAPRSPHLSPVPPARYRRARPPERSPAVAEGERLLKEGIDRAIAIDKAERAGLAAYWKTIEKRTPLMVAIGRGDAAAVVALTDAGAAVDETNPHGRTALAFAAEDGSEELVALLLQRGARPDARDADGQTPASLAAAGDHIAALAALAPSPELRQEAAQAAVRARALGALAHLLAEGADPDSLDEEARTPLMHALAAGDAQLARTLLRAGAVIDHIDSTGRTPLHHAATGGHGELVTELLDAGADPSIPDLEGEVALVTAARAGRAASLGALLARPGATADATADAAGGETALVEAFRAAMEGEHAAVATVLRERSVALTRAPEALTPFFRAIDRDDPARVRIALEAGVSLDARDERGAPALSRAIDRRSEDVAELLLTGGADVEARGPDGRAPLHHAAIGDTPDILLGLIAAGADLDHRDESGATALHRAASANDLDSVTVLLRHGADPAVTDHEGRTPLAAARTRRATEAIVTLLARATEPE